jgi:hypothetical protein
MGAWEDFLLHEMLPAIEQRFGCGGTGRRGVFGKSSGGYGAVTHALRHSDIWSAAACHSGDMGFELCYLPDMPAVLRALAGAGNSIEGWWHQLEEGQKHPEGSGKVVNALAMAASYDPDPTQFFGIRLPVTFDTCEVIEERWANWLRQDPVIAIETQGSNLRRLKALYIDCGIFRILRDCAQGEHQDAQRDRVYTKIAPYREAGLGLSRTIFVIMVIGAWHFAFPSLSSWPRSIHFSRRSNRSASCSAIVRSQVDAPMRRYRDQASAKLCSQPTRTEKEIKS